MKFQILLSKMMKERENVEVDFEPCIGTVIKELPDLTISIWDGATILFPSKLYINDRLCGDYTREFNMAGKFEKVNIKASTSNVEAGPGPHSHQHGTIEGAGEFEATGTIINTDTLKIGDYVRVIPTEKGQKWFVDSKYRKVEA